MPEGNPFGYLILLAALIACNALFAMSEIAVISFNDAKLKRLADDGNKKAAALYKLTREPSKFLSTIQVGVTLSGFLSSAVAADNFTEYIVYFLRNSGIPVSVLRSVSLVVITLVLSFLSLVFGELVPKRIAMNDPERISFAVAGILRVVYSCSKPLVALVSGATNGVLRLIGIDPDKNDNEVTEEEIRMMIDVGEEEGNIEVSEREMLHNIFEFDDRTAGDIMTHRTEVEALDDDAPLSEIIDTAIHSGHSRIPVYGEDLDDIIGVLNVKDLLRLVGTEPADFNIKNYLREVMYVPESSRCKDIFEEFRKQRLQLAIVVDEYGGTAGIVSMEDILESIVGNIQDEYDNETEDVRVLENGNLLLDGMALLEDLTDRFDMKFADAGDYDTIAGYVIDKLGRLPKSDEHPVVEANGWRFTVQGVQDHRITAVEAEKVNTPAETTEEN